MTNKTKFFFLGFILILAFFLRLYKINSPLADWHSWRQADTAAVGRHFVKNGINLLLPRYDDLSSIPSGLENPEGYRMVELPILGALQALTYRIFSIGSFEVTCRLLSIFFSLLTIIFLYLIIQAISGPLLGLLTAFIYALLPYNLYYNRVILPEPLMVFTALASIYFFMSAIFLKEKAKDRKQNKQLSLKTFLLLFTSLLFFAISLLIKPFVLFLIMPPITYLAAKEFVKTEKKVLWFCGFVVYILAALLPFLLWRWWVSHFPEGIPANLWLLNGDGVRFKGAWFYWIFAERLARLILGYWGVIFLVTGLLINLKEKMFYCWWSLGILAYLVIVATGNVRHDYYQILIMPVVAALVARGIYFFLNEGKKVFNLYQCWLLVIICWLFMEAFSWYQVRDFFNINHPEIVKAGKAIQKLSQPEDKVIAPYGGDTAFLYQTERKGWPVGGNLEEKIKKGAKYYVSVNFDQETRELITKCQIRQKENDFVIIDLSYCNLVAEP